MRQVSITGSGPGLETARRPAGQNNRATLVAQSKGRVNKALTSLPGGVHMFFVADWCWTGERPSCICTLIIKMSITERKQEEKQEMHKRILDGARKIFLEKGYDYTSMRNIAEEISYSPGSLYNYFKDKSEIFHKLHREGFLLLINQLKVLNKVSDPFERLKASGRVFIQFAQENKDYYNLMFIVDEPVKNSPSERFQIAEEAISHMQGIVKECQQKGRFKDMDTEYFTFLIISVVHGICALCSKHRTTSFVGKSDEELMSHGYECIVALLEKS